MYAKFSNPNKNENIDWLTTANKTQLINKKT
jgi:hypothetical protein